MGRAVCSVLITVATGSLLKAVKAVSEDMQAKARYPGLPWEIWEGRTKVWKASEPEYLRVDRLDMASGSARVPVGDLLQAVVETHPDWTVKRLLQATRISAEDLEEARILAHETAEAIKEKEEKLGPQSRVALAKNAEQVMLASVAPRIRTKSDPARTGAADSGAEERWHFSLATAAAEALAEAQAREESINAAISAVDTDEYRNGLRDRIEEAKQVDPSFEENRAQDLNALYENFTVWVRVAEEVRVNGKVEPEKWVVLPIDMCLHGGC